MIRDLISIILGIIFIGTLIFGLKDFYELVERKSIKKVGTGLPKIEKFSRKLTEEFEKAKGRQKSF